MEQLQAVREEAFERFAEAQAAALARLAYQLTGHRESARDLVQDVLLEAFRHWPKVSTARSQPAYVRRMLVNRHLNRVRRRHIQEVAGVDDPHPAAADRQAPFLDQVHADHDAMWRALATLPHRQRTVLVLRYYEGLDDVAIAETVGCRRTTVRSLAARGLSALRTDPNLQHPAEPDRRSTR